jgi:NADH dehydrogenase
MQVAIAGGSGFVGRHLVRTLAAQGHTLRLLVRSGAGTDTWSQGQAVVAVDLGADPAAIAEAVRGCDALVNLVGIKTARAQSFERAHVEVVRRMIAGCEAAGVGRMIHVSVAGLDAAARGPYRESKWAGEQVVAGSRLAWTIVRPGVIYGEGDDFIANLAAMLRHAAVFPAPGGGVAPLQPVAVEDVAEAIAGALARPETVGQRLDVVGPERLPVREWVARVAGALGLRVWQVPAPARLLAPAVAGLERILPSPPLTRAQLGLLANGVVGDVAHTRALLGREPMALTSERIVELARDVPPWLGVSLRLPGEGFAAASVRPLGVLVPAAAIGIAALRATTPDIWRCMALANLVLIPAALLAIGLPWRAMMRPRVWHLVFGTVAAAVLYVLGWLGAAALTAIAPQLMAQVSELYAWGSLLPVAVGLPLLFVIVCGEEIFWRAGVALPVAARLGPWWGCLASATVFTLAHVMVGPPVLWLAAFACGLVWAWMVVRTRSLIPGIVCHYLWDVAVMFVAPY